MFRLFKSRMVWLAVGVLTLAGTAFWTAVAIVAAIMTAAARGADPNPEDLARVAVPIGLLAAASAVGVAVVVMVMVRRGRARHWMPLREQMLEDAATLPATHLAQVVSRPNPAAGQQLLAVDLLTGHQGPLWLLGWNLPRGAVVCFTDTPAGPQVRAWMTAQLWRATTREAARIERRTVRGFAEGQRARDEAALRHVRDAGQRLVAEAERILREHGRT